MLHTILLAAALIQSPAGLPTSVDQVPTPELREYHPPVPAKTTAAGAPLLLLEDHDLPLVDGLILFEAGSLRDPEGKTGLADFFAEALRQGGSAAFTGDEFNAWLNAHAAELSISSNENQLRVSFNCLSEDTPELIARIGQLLTAPSFEQAAVDMIRMQTLTALARQKDDAAALADQTMDKLLYGSRTPFGRQETEEGVAGITREDLAAFAAENLGRDRMYLGLSGDFEAAAAKEQLATSLGALPALGAAAELPQPVFNRLEQSTIYVVDRPGVPQTELRIGGPGLQIDAPDQPALTVWSYVVGTGGMTNRMMMRVRTELGLAYGVGCGFSPRLWRPGTFYGYSATRNDAVGQALGEMLEIITESAALPIPSEELEASRNQLLAGHVFRLDSAAELLERALTLEFAGKPGDFWEKNLVNLERVTAGEIQAAARRHIPPGRFLCVAVGPADEIIPSLSKVAEVVRLDGPTDLVDADAAVKAMLDALGGREAWARLETVHIKQVATIAYPNGNAEVPVEQWRRFAPLSIRLRQRTPGATTYTNVMTPDAGWLKGPTGVSRVPAEQISVWQEVLGRWLYYNLHRLAVKDSDLQAGLGEDGRLMLFDSTGPVGWIELGADHRPTAMGAETNRAEKVYHYSNWTEADGIFFARTYTEGDQTIEVELFEPYVELDDKTFSL